MARARAVVLAPFREVVHLNDLVATTAGARIDVLDRFGGKPADRIVVQNTGKKEIKVHLSSSGVSGGFAIVRTKEDLDLEVVVSEFFVSGTESFEVTLFRRG